MRSVWRILIVAIAILIGIAVAGLFVAYRAAKQVPAFYDKALAVAPESQEQESDRMLNQAIELHNSLRKEGQWQEVFNEDTINGWLAVDLPRNHPLSLPSGMSDPRVHVTSQGMNVACQIDRSGFHGVVSLEVSAYIDSPNVIGLRVHKARLGAIPWSLDRVLKGISDAARHSDLKVAWRQTEGDPVALVTLPNPSGGKGKVFRIETIRFDEGSITLGGTTERVK